MLRAGRAPAERRRAHREARRDRRRHGARNGPSRALDHRPVREAPTVHRAFDYGLRWGIEAMFSDFETRGFGLEDSHLRRPERLDRLILALALFWAVSTGMWDAVHDATPDEKSPGSATPQPPPRPDLPLQARHPPPPGLPAAARRPTAVMGRVAELMGGKRKRPRPVALPRGA